MPKPANTPLKKVEPSESQKNISGPDGVGTRAALEKLRGQLLTERSTFLSHWSELARFILPRRPRFFTTTLCANCNWIKRIEQNELWRKVPSPLQPQ